MKYISENAAGFTVLLLALSMVVGAAVWVATEINDVRDDLSNTELRLTEQINGNAAEINARLDRIEQRMEQLERRSEQRFETLLDALAGHTHADDGSPTFTKPTAQENPADAQNENRAAQR